MISSARWRATACKAPRQPWQSRHRRQCGICNLHNPKGLTESESHPLRQHELICFQSLSWRSGFSACNTSKSSPRSSPDRSSKTLGFWPRGCFENRRGGTWSFHGRPGICLPEKAHNLCLGQSVRAHDHCARTGCSALGTSASLVPSTSLVAIAARFALCAAVRFDVYSSSLETSSSRPELLVGRRETLLCGTRLRAFVYSPSRKRTLVLV